MTREKKFFAPVLKSYGDRLDVRWRWEWWEPTHNGAGAVRKVEYGKINTEKTVEGRYRVAQEMAKYFDFAPRESKLSVLERVMQIGQLEWRPKTFQTYGAPVKRFELYMGKRGTDSATEEDVNAFLRAEQEKGSKVGTLYKYRTCLFSLYRKGIAMGITKHNPVARTSQIQRAPTSLDYFTNGQIDLIKQACQGSQLWLCIELLFYCYIRPGEMRQLKIGDVNFEMGYIQVRAEVSKNKKSQKVVIPDHFLKKLEYLKNYHNSQYIISKSLTPGGVQVSKKWIYLKHMELLAELKIRGNYSFYSWKHTGVVKAVQAGLNIMDIKNQLRHHSLDMVQEYLKNLGVLQSMDLKHRFPEL